MHRILRDKRANEQKKELLVKDLPPTIERNIIEKDKNEKEKI